MEFSFAADRNKLYVAWQALANLADLCGNVTVSVKGEPPQNIDKSKLENGVYEPLREANLIDYDPPWMKTMTSLTTTTAIRSLHHSRMRAIGRSTAARLSLGSRTGLLSLSGLLVMGFVSVISGSITGAV